MTFNENWICREVPAVLLISPNPLPSTTFDGNPKFTMLNTLKNSARNCTIPNSFFPRRPNDVSLIKLKSKSLYPGPRNVSLPNEPNRPGFVPDLQTSELVVIRKKEQLFCPDPK